MNLYEPKHLADSMRVVRKNTIAIAEDIPEAQYDYRPTQDSRSVRETLLHMASMTLFDLHVHEEQKRTSMEGFDFREFFAGLPTNEKCSLPKAEIVAVLRDEGERWCDWVEKLPEARAVEFLTRGGAGPGDKSRFEMLIGSKEPEIHHRPQLMGIERLLGIVPHLTWNRRARGLGKVSCRFEHLSRRQRLGSNHRTQRKNRRRRFGRRFEDQRSDTRSARSRGRQRQRRTDPWGARRPTGSRARRTGAGGCRRRGSQSQGGQSTD